MNNPETQQPADETSFSEIVESLKNQGAQEILLKDPAFTPEEIEERKRTLMPSPDADNPHPKILGGAWVYKPESGTFHNWSTLDLIETISSSIDLNATIERDGHLPDGVLGLNSVTGQYYAAKFALADRIANKLGPDHPLSQETKTGSGRFARTIDEDTVLTIVDEIAKSPFETRS